VLGQDDRERLAEIERRLAVEDPAFAARMRSGRGRYPGGRRRTLLMMLALWATLLVLAIVAGWTAVTAALLVVAVVETGRRAWRALRDAGRPAASGR